MPRISTYVVGRERGCDVRLDHGSVSRHHAEVVRVPGGGRLYVTDRATTNGTFVLDGDEWRAIRQAFLDPTGRIRFGDVEMSARRLDELCPRGDVRPSDDDRRSRVSPPKEDLQDSGNGLVRDPETGELLPRRPPVVR